MGHEAINDAGACGAMPLRPWACMQLCVPLNQSDTAQCPVDTWPSERTPSGLSPGKGLVLPTWTEQIHTCQRQESGVTQGGSGREIDGGGLAPSFHSLRYGGLKTPAVLCSDCFYVERGPGRTACLSRASFAVIFPRGCPPHCSASGFLKGSAALPPMTLIAAPRASLTFCRQRAEILPYLCCSVPHVCASTLQTPILPGKTHDPGRHAPRSFGESPQRGGGDPAHTSSSPAAVA